MARDPLPDGGRGGVGVFMSSQGAALAMIGAVVRVADKLPEEGMVRCISGSRVVVLAHGAGESTEEYPLAAAPLLPLGQFARGAHDLAPRRASPFASGSRS